MNYLRIITLFILLYILLIQCSSTNYITKPSILPDNYYYDNENFLMFKNPGTVEDYINTYIEWRKNNSKESLLKNYSDLFKLIPNEINKKNFNVNPDNEEDYFAISKKPSFLEKSAPKMPKSAIIQGENRLIVISVLIEKNGEVYVAQLFDISDGINKQTNHKTELPYIDKNNLSNADKDMIYESLIAAVKFRFSPAVHKDTKVRVIMNVPFRFSFK
jgi:hypothetical protein